MAKNSINYFDTFVTMCNYSIRAANMLKDTVTNFNPDEMEKRIVDMHSIEHAADIEKHRLMEALMREFLPPIEREDISELAQHIDDLTDAIEDVVLRLYMFNIRKMRAEAFDFTEIILKCCSAVEMALVEFKNFKKSATLKELIIQINTLEELGDKIYTASIRSLYTEEGVSSTEVLAWRETFQRFEKCCDNAEDIAEVIEAVIMKNN